MNQVTRNLIFSYTCRTHAHHDRDPLVVTIVVPLTLKQMPSEQLLMRWINYHLERAGHQAPNAWEILGG